MTVIAGDHNLAARPGGRPDPRNAWTALSVPAGAFYAVAFAPGAPRATNAHDVLANAQWRREFDHAFVGRATCAAWQLRASGRVLRTFGPSSLDA